MSDARTTLEIARLRTETDLWPRECRFLRGLGPEGKRGNRLMGSPLHPVIMAEDVIDPYTRLVRADRLRVTAFLASAAFGPREGTLAPALDKRGHKTERMKLYVSPVPGLDHPNRYFTVTLDMAEYETLPLCSWQLRNGEVTNVRRLDGVDEIAKGD